jgi:competence ComEA-like helix-hairpin-helix protein
VKNTALLQKSDSQQNRIQSFAFIIAVCVCVLLGLCFCVSKPFATEHTSKIELESRINPNKASISSLARLPGIGISKAAAIIAYRENFSKKEPNSTAFTKPEDLQKIRGIGPKTVQKISDYLKYE